MDFARDRLVGVARVGACHDRSKRAKAERKAVGSREDSEPGALDEVGEEEEKKSATTGLRLGYYEAGVMDVSATELDGACHVTAYDCCLAGEGASTNYGTLTRMRRQPVHVQLQKPPHLPIETSDPVMAENREACGRVSDNDIDGTHAVKA